MNYLHTWYHASFLRSLGESGLCIHGCMITKLSLNFLFEILPLTVHVAMFLKHISSSYLPIASYILKLDAGKS